MSINGAFTGLLFETEANVGILDFKFMFVGMKALVIDAPEFVVGFEEWLDSEKSETLNETCFRCINQQTIQLQTPPKNTYRSREGNHGSQHCSSYYTIENYS